VPYLTPDSAPVGYGSFLLFLPVDSGGDPILSYEAIVKGALLTLTEPRNFEEYGSQTPEQVAEVFQVCLMLSTPFVGGT